MKVAILFCLVGATLALPSPVSVGFNGGSGKIIGGEDAAKGAYPWQVSLQRTPAGTTDTYHMCGASILNATHVLCAGHCVKDQDVSELEIVSGAHNITDRAEASQQRRAVKSYRLHENYNGVLILNDISIIELESPIEITEFAKPIALCQAEPAAQEPVINTGWGNAHPTGDTPAVLPDILQEVALHAITRPTCRLNYPLNIQAYMICAKGDVQSGACNGDSGGPLVYKPAGSDEFCLTGIVSFGKQPCGNAPSVYTGVPFFLDWIAN